MTVNSESPNRNAAKRRDVWANVIYPITGYFRKQRGDLLRTLFPNIETMNVCDLGGSLHFWQHVGIELPADHLTLVNVDESVNFISSEKEPPKCRVVIYDGANLPFPDKSFDLLLCNSTIEHVPVQDRQSLVKEMMRVSRRGFLQTPAFEFPIEPHFLMPAVHWLPKYIGSRLVLISPWRLLSRPTAETIDSYFHGTNLLTRGDVQRLFPAGYVLTERFCGLPKSHCAVMDRQTGDPL